MSGVRASNIGQWFRCINQKPEWLQEPEWQYSGGKPMVFVGQVNVPAGRNVFHHDAAFYVFWQPETGETKTVIQVAWRAAYKRFRSFLQLKC